MLFRHLNVATFSLFGTTARASGLPPLPPNPATPSSWFLDSSASFHMTPILPSCLPCPLSITLLSFRQLTAPLFQLLDGVFSRRLPFMCLQFHMFLTSLCS